MTLLNTFKTALLGLAANKLRSSLTTLGIIIGVASVIAMLALGNGARVAVEASFEFLGADIIQLSRKQKFDDGKFGAVGQPLTYEDGLVLVDEVELVKRVQMNVSGFGKIRYGRFVLDMDISGVTGDVLDVLTADGKVQPVGWPEEQALTGDAFIAQGRFFTPSEVLAGADVCVLGHKTAIDLFQGDNAIGETVWVNRQRCLIIGILTELETTALEERFKSEPNDAFYMPISTAIQMLYDETPSVFMAARVTDESRIDEAKAQIATFLRQRHNVEKDAEGNYQDDFSMLTRKDILGQQQKSAQTFALLLAAMAFVSLVVGGIGIMNVMLVSVTERTREIGVRLAMGASGQDIVSQFSLEAIVLSAGGGFLGVAVGVLVIPLAASLNEGIAVLDPKSIPLAFGLSLLTGLIFGLYPALRASRLDPVEALRYE